MQKLEHSIKVPYIYKASSTIVRKVKEERGSLKTLIFNSNKHSNLKGLYALSFKTLEKEDVVNRLIESSQILVNEKKADPWLIRVLVTELLFGKQALLGESKPVQVVLSYQDALHAGLEQLGTKATHSSGSNNIPVDLPRWVRVNILKISVADALEHFQSEGWNLIPSEEIKSYRAFRKRVSKLAVDEFVIDFHMNEVLAFPNRTELFSHELYLNGSIVLQDKASCLSSWILNPPPGSTVLDMCAAPGTKTTHLAALMGNKGTLHAADMSMVRYKVLCDMVERNGAECVKTHNADALTLDAESCPGVEYILVDPSCSGSGLVLRHQNEYDSARLRRLATFQFKILLHALTNFPDVKRVVYSTCSIEPEENEAVVASVLDVVNSENQIFELANDSLEGEWVNYGSDAYNGGPSCLYARPHVDLTNGFFIASFNRVGGHDTPSDNLGKNKETDSSKKKSRKRKKSKATIETPSDHFQNTFDDDEYETGRTKKERRKKKRDKLESGGNNRPEELSDGIVEHSGTKRKKIKSDIIQSGEFEVTDIGESESQRKKKGRRGSKTNISKS